MYVEQQQQQRWQRQLTPMHVKKRAAKMSRTGPISLSTSFTCGELDAKTNPAICSTQRSGWGFDRHSIN